MRMTMSEILSRTKSTLSAAKKGAKSKETKISRKTIAIAVAAFIITSISVGTASFNVSYALEVNYKGETIGYVSSRNVYTKAISNIKKNSDEAIKKNIKSVKIEETVASVDSVLNAKDLEDTIIEKVENAEELFGLYINDELYAVLKSEAEIKNTQNKFLKSQQNGIEDIKFLDAVEIKKGYFDISAVIDEAKLLEMLYDSEIKVGGYKSETRTEKISYKTEKSKSDSYPVGETVITRNGVNGKQKVNVKVFYENGKPVKEEIVSKEVIKKPVSKKITVGTGERFSLDFPVKNNYYVSSDYGEWRGGYSHQGMDIVSSYGNPIYASAGGTVIESGYSPYGWGYNVLIDHGNGIRTRYAHCSSLDVSVGQKVVRGEKIAEIGMTGDASCNHVHYEVYSGGVRINPHSYLVN